MNNVQYQHVRVARPRRFILVHELKLDRSAYLREILRKGFSLDKQERLIGERFNTILKQELNYEFHVKN